MWVADFKVQHKGSVALDLTKEYAVTVLGFYLNTFQENGKNFINRVVIVKGRDKEKFVRRLNEDKRIKINKLEGDQIFYQIPIEKSGFHMLVLDKSVFFVKPIIYKNGFQYWALASWEKKNLINLYNKIKDLKERAKIEILSLKKEKIDFFIPNILTHLTEKQKKAIILAQVNGYYSFPRKIDVQGLAKLAKTPRTSFQDHLRKAELKLINAVLNQGSFEPE